MEKWIFSSGNTLLLIIASALMTYVVVILFTRFFGKRSFSKMSSFDFACTIAIGSIIASTVLTSSVSLLDGIVGLLTIYASQYCIAYLRRFTLFKNLVDNEPILLMDGKEILWNNLRTAKVTEDDLKAKLREANVIDLNEVRAVILETTGDIAVLHTSEAGKSVEKWLLQGVSNS